MQLTTHVPTAPWALIALLAGMFMLGVAAAEPPEAIDGTTRIDAEGLIERVQADPDVVIIDARTPEDRSAGFIEGSIGLPDYETTPDALAAVIPSKNTPVVFYCNGVKCGRSVTAALVAVAAGYGNVYWFRGGWEEWTEKGLPVAFD